jgi:hypothetical protein
MDGFIGNHSKSNSLNNGLLSIVLENDKFLALLVINPFTGLAHNHGHKQKEQGNKENAKATAIIIAILLATSRMTTRHPLANQEDHKAETSSDKE